MREHLGSILRPVRRQRLDPLGRSTVLCYALGSRNLAIGNVAHQDVAEFVLRLAGDRRAASARDELSPHERTQPLFELCDRDAADRRERTGPEDLSENGRVLEQRLSVEIERVEARRDDALQGLGQFRLLTALRIHAHELLGVEGVAPGACEEGSLRLRGEHRPVQQLRDQASGLVFA